MASCYEEAGWQSINDGPPAEGRVALAAVAASYMEAFPDLQVSLDQLLTAGDSAFFVWTLTGTNTGPCGTGNSVRVSGIEVWKMGDETIVWGLYDQLRRPTLVDTACAKVHADFREITGHLAPGPTSGACSIDAG